MITQPSTEHNFRENFKYLRKKHGLTQQQFVAEASAQGFTITQSRISHIETGNTSIWAHELHCVANLFKIPMSDLWLLESESFREQY